MGNRQRQVTAVSNYFFSFRPVCVPLQQPVQLKHSTNLFFVLFWPFPFFNENKPRREEEERNAAQSLTTHEAPCKVGGRKKSH